MRRYTGALLTIFVLLNAAIRPCHGQTHAVDDTHLPLGGLHVVLGAGDPDALVEAGADDRRCTHWLDTDAERVAALRGRVLDSHGTYGRASVDTWDGRHLPYADDLVSRVTVLDAECRVSAQEIERVLSPRGTAWVPAQSAIRFGLSESVGNMRVCRKPVPDNIDDWTHYLHDSGNNAVAHDDRVGPPRSLRWVGSPRWARHHDRMASMSALVSAAGRIFYIFDEGATSSVVLPSKWALIARDAFNGVVLWKQPIKEWQTRMWPLKSGPAQLPRRLVATETMVFATLRYDDKVRGFDARFGDELRRFEGTEGTEEILFADGIVYALTDPNLNRDKYTNAKAVNRPWWTGGVSRLVAIDAAMDNMRRQHGCKTLWQHESPVVPLSLAVSDGRVVWHDGERIHCLDAKTGKALWKSVPVPMVKRVMSFFAPTMVVRDGVVLFAGGEESGLVKSTGGATKSDTLTALAAGTGKVLWTAKHPPSGYSSPEDVFVTGGVVWSGGVSNGNLPGGFTGHDLHSGEVVRTFKAADAKTYWFHHRCYRGRATDRYLMVSRTGIEFIDPKTGHWDINHWTRGSCLYGIMPANGLIYAPPHNCACYPESKTYGFCAMSAEGPEIQEAGAPERLEKGPGYSLPIRQSSSAEATEDKFAIGDRHSEDWPTYRYDASRSGASPGAVPGTPKEQWMTDLRGRLSSVTVAADSVFVAEVDRHTVHALDAATGRRKWRFAAGGRVDSPPTIHDGMAIFGCADGYIYCLRAADGELAWRFRAAPVDERIMAFEQLESRWPLHGSVLVHDGKVHAIAGRSLFFDSGMRLCCLDAMTGKLVSEVMLDSRDPESGDDVQGHVKRLTMPVALPDVLSTDGRHMYMRSQVFDMNGKRLELAPVAAGLGAHAKVQQGPTAHLFASAGFLDDSWFHRSYWVYGRKFEGGWNSYYLAGKRAPAGKMLVADGNSVYGFGRQPKYFKWTVPMEFHLFAAPRGGASAVSEAPEPSDQGSIIRVDKTKRINPAGKALTVMAWVKPEKANGTIVAHGGSIHGYVLYLRKGIPHFGVRANSKGGALAGPARVPSGWVHLAGVLDQDAGLRLYVNGRAVAKGKAPGLIPKEPANTMQIGMDEESEVIQDASVPFKGLMDEVCIYHRALSATEIAAFGGQAAIFKMDRTDQALHFSFDKGKVVDAAGRKLPVQAVGLQPAEGRLGGGMRFAGKKPGAALSETDQRFTWSEAVPVLVRGMVAAGGTLFVAGPEDLVDEPTALKNLSDEAVKKRLQRQEAALAGELGGVLRGVSCADGATRTEIRVETVPVWDGLVAARGRLFMAGVDGTVRCYGEKRR
jgi:outer membrane protein assembly factor BamB